MNIRTYRPGDEKDQVAIYNEAAADLPKFKPATVEEITKRYRARDFDPGTRFYAEENGKIVGYANFHVNGRVSFPWCRKGHENQADPLFQRVLETMKSRGISAIFAAYRSDWPGQKDFFLAQGFHQAREMVNYLLDQGDMPTRPGRRNNPLTPLKKEDVPAIFELAPQVLKVHSPDQLERYLFHNPYFGPEETFVLRNRDGGIPVAVGILVSNQAYGDPKQVDSCMPCFRLGAFGTEGMPTKRLNGLFSFLTKDQRLAGIYAQELMGHAASLLEDCGATSLAAQAPSDAEFLIRFYNRYFRRQGSFPIFERTL
ncbi:MAG TPA: hypothetical protein VGY77_12855 [Gemmataceae bacterium]|nr:hypothetical protein [Gemmataceae bacterium]